jgi:hypothetical protein
MGKSTKAGHKELLPSEVRRIVLDEHGLLRARIAELRQIADEGELDALRAAAHGLFRRLEAHLDTEDELLVPILRTIDAWGPDRAARVSRDHAAQREWIASSDAWLAVTRSFDEARERIAGFLLALEADMELEERRDLDPALLSDLGPAPDLGTGID